MNNVSLPEAIHYDGFALNWENTDLSKCVKQHMARLNEAAFALRGLDEVLEADEFLTDKHNQGTFEYEWLQPDVRWRLRCAKRMLSRELERQINLVYKAVSASKPGEALE